MTAIVTIKFVLFLDKHMSEELRRDIEAEFGPRKWRICTVTVTAPLLVWTTIGAKFKDNGRVDQEFHNWFRNQAVYPTIIGLMSRWGWPTRQGACEYVVTPEESEVVRMFELAREKLDSQFMKESRNAREANEARRQAEAFAEGIGGDLALSVKTHKDVRARVLDFSLRMVGQIVKVSPDMITNSVMHKVNDTITDDCLEMASCFSESRMQEVKSQIPKSIKLEVLPNCVISTKELDFDLNDLGCVVVQATMPGIAPQYGIWVV